MLPPNAAALSMRIAKRIARSGACSRREAERWIEMGRVTLNGKVITSPAVNVTPQDIIHIDNKPLSPIQRTRVIIANKLDGELITTVDSQRIVISCCSPSDRPTIFDRLKKTGLECHIMPVVSILQFCVVGAAGFSHRRAFAADKWWRLCALSGAPIQRDSPEVPSESVWAVGGLKSAGVKSQQYYRREEVQRVSRQTGRGSHLGQRVGTLVHNSGDGRQGTRERTLKLCCSSMKSRIC